MSDRRIIRLTLAYDGSGYLGWQVQPGGPTIQSALEAAIAAVTGEECPVYSAGRTDAGVHALGQVASFSTASRIPPANFRPALQSHLPRDIVVLDAREAPQGFHATFSARRKHYRYLIDNSPVPLPFLRAFSWQVRRPLQAAAMNVAAGVLVGTFDFRSFETDWPNKKSSVRTIESLAVTRRCAWELWSTSGFPRAGAVGHRDAAIDGGTEAREPAIDANLICVDIVADGFLYNMVRSIVGTLVNVGRSKWSAVDVGRIRDAKCRSAAGATAPARGLYLVQVWYE